jgi:hypothetical protein
VREQSNTNTLRRNSPHAFSWVRTTFNGRRSLRPPIAHVDLAVAAPLSGDRCVMDKDMRAVTAPGKTICPDSGEPFNAAKHLVSFQKSFVQPCKREKLHKWFLQ